MRSLCRSESRCPCRGRVRYCRHETCNSDRAGVSCQRGGADGVAGAVARVCRGLRQLPMPGAVRGLKVVTIFVLLATCFVQGASPKVGAVAQAAARFRPELTWQPKSVIKGDFNCDGRSDVAILGTNAEHIGVAIFVSGLARKPEYIEYSARAFNVRLVTIHAEDMDFDAKELANDIGYELKGMRRSKTCKGISLNDDATDASHIYWNHLSRLFEDWRL
jgi:hypothetical protein